MVCAVSEKSRFLATLGMTVLEDGVVTEEKSGFLATLGMTSLGGGAEEGYWWRTPREKQIPPPRAARERSPRVGMTMVELWWMKEPN